MDIWWLEICNIVGWVVHVVPNIRLGVCLENTQEAYCPECLVPTVEHGGGSVIILAAIFWYPAGHISILNGWITASDYVTILGNQVHTVVQMLFPNNDAIFQDDSSPIHTARSVQPWFEEHEDALRLPWPAQSPDLNVIILLWSLLGSRVRSRFSPSSLKQLDVLHEEWFIITLETVQNLHESIPRRLQAVLRKMMTQIHINKEMFIFHSCFRNVVHPL